MSEANALLLIKEGITAAKSGNKSLARHLLRRATELAPEIELGWLWLGGVTESPEEVVGHMQRVLEINPNNQRAQAGLKWARAEIARRAPAWVCPLCQSPAPMPTDRCPACGAVLSLNDLGNVLANWGVDQNRLQGAIERLETIPAGRVSFDVHYRLGLAYLNLRRMDMGIRHLAAALQLQPDDQTLRTQLRLLMRQYEATRPPVKPQKQYRGTVLVVDDSPTICKLVAITLEGRGYRVMAASDGMEALARMSEGMPDLILLDVMMPRLDGYQVCKIIKGNVDTRDVPIVMLSGKDGFFDKVRGRMAGSTEYITKPFEPETLIDVMERHIADARTREGVERGN